jgi:hypothetical protein
VIDYRSKGHVFFMNFRLTIDHRGLRVMRDEMFFNDRIQGRIFDGFGNQISNDINEVFRKRFIEEEERRSWSLDS